MEGTDGDNCNESSGLWMDEDECGGEVEGKEDSLDVEALIDGGVHLNE